MYVVLRKYISAEDTEGKQKQEDEMKKRILSMLLVLVLMATLVPVSASAAVTIYWPVPGHTRLSQGYHANNAIDISDGSINGATVIAAASGTVTHIYLCSNTHNDSYSIQHPESTDCNGFGTGLVIKADDGRIYQYAHMQGGSIPSNVYHGAYVRSVYKELHADHETGAADNK